MLRTIEAVIDENGNVRLLEAVRLPAGLRALVTVLDEAGVVADGGALLSERALATDSSRPQEDAAWAHLQRAR